jgi:transcriptional regulator of heat shock response
MDARELNEFRQLEQQLKARLGRTTEADERQQVEQQIKQTQRKIQQAEKQAEKQGGQARQP